jgi:membrane-associated phospholipid phosphatase
VNVDILNINKLALDLVAKDFSDGHAPNNGGPTKTARALAIIHLAARDAYAKVTGTYPAKLAGLPNKPAGLGATDGIGTSAAIGAGIRACTLLYPDFSGFINEQALLIGSGVSVEAMTYGCEIAEKWVASRQNDGSGLPQLDAMYSNDPGHYRPDPLSKLPAFGRTWGLCPPFILADVAADAPLGPPPALNTQDYATAFDDVFENGRDNITERIAKFRRHAVTGIFWGYDGSNKLGTPPRLYNQVVVKSADFMSLTHSAKINVLAAINAAMADAGIAAWYWKYVYDFWRPVVAIREADAGFGPSKLGDGNTLRKHKGDPFWKPLGAPRSNPIAPLKVGAEGDNFTPNFPAYPSGHASFGTACFETFAGLLVNKKPKDISVTFVSDEFNGVTTDNTGTTRPVWEQTFTLKDAIEQNKISRIYLGVHWSFDASGGETVGTAVATKAVAAFV